MYNQYVAMMIAYIIAYMYAIVFAPKITECGKDCQDIENIHRKCLIRTPLARKVTGGRGNSYYIGASNSHDELEDCLVTFWGGTHFALYTALGFVAPDLFWQTFAIGVGFEVYEYFKYDCHDPIDVVLNTAGFVLGKTARHYI